MGNALDLLAGTHGGPAPKSFWYPWQLPSALLDQRIYSGYLNHSFPVIVGNTPEDLSLAWNSLVWNGASSQPLNNHLWLPDELVHASGVHQGLAAWIYRMTGGGSSHPRKVEMLSSNLNAGKLDDLFKALQLGHVRERPAAAESQIQKARIEAKTALSHATRHLPEPSLRRDVHRFAAQHHREFFTLPNLKLLEVLNASGGWMADVQIEAHSVYKPSMSVPTWWQIPRRGGADLLQGMFRAPARARVSALPTVFVEVKDLWATSNPTLPILEVSIPEHEQVARHIVAMRGKMTWSVSQDLRSNASNSLKFTKVQRSDKGSYLLAAIKLFGDLSTAARYCRKKFWLDVFSPSVEAAKRERSIDPLAATLRREFRRFQVKGLEDKATEIAERLVSASKLPTAPGSTTFKKLCKALAKGAQPHAPNPSTANANQGTRPYNTPTFAEDEMQNDLTAYPNNPAAR